MKLGAFSACLPSSPTFHRSHLSATVICHGSHNLTTYADVQKPGTGGRPFCPLRLNVTYLKPRQELRLSFDTSAVLPREPLQATCTS
jgi:hypothetical protein